MRLLALHPKLPFLTEAPQWLIVEHCAYLDLTSGDGTRLPLQQGQRATSVVTGWV